MTHKKRSRLGDMLVEEGIITKDQLSEALERHRKTNRRLGDILIDLGFTTEEIIMKSLSHQLGIPHVNLADIEIDPYVIGGIPEFIARRHRLIPLYKENNTLTVAMADPMDILAIDEIKRMIGCEIKPVIASEVEIREAIERYYKKILSLEMILKDVDLENKIKLVEKEVIDTANLQIDGNKAPVINLVNHILIEAIKVGASDIHIEPYGDDLRIRYRIDGILYPVPSPPKQFHSAIVSRIKVMSSLDLAEHRLPQDGRTRVILEGREIDLRISIIPSSSEGEKVVMRILDPAGLCLDLTQLGFEGETLSIFKEMIQKPYGIILVTGPTGSGKSTTLYSALKTINQPSRNIITIEDPIEYSLLGITQVQANPYIGLTFASGLRAFLRQDPDVIMVGEIRDKETAEVAIHAALTGHLIFSTLHTNNAAGAIVRLVNMEIEPFLISSSVLVSIAQRLVRKICPKCKEAYSLPTEALKDVGFKIEEEMVTLYRGTGCKNCNNVGYKGRIGIYEILVIDDQIQEMVIRREASPRIKEVAQRSGMTTLWEAATKKVLSGVTTVEEVLRIITES